jgi:hypothetical protein
VSEKDTPEGLMAVTNPVTAVQLTKMNDQITLPIRSTQLSRHYVIINITHINLGAFRDGTHPFCSGIDKK